MLRLRKRTSPKIRYAGSCIQQNHGEPLEGHGYSLWDLSTYTYEFKEIPNNYGYFTIDIVKGKLSTELTKMPSKVRLRVNCHETIATEVKQVISDLKTKADIIDISYERIEPDTNKLLTNNISKHIVLAKLADVAHQNELIKKYVVETLKISDADKLKHILKINKETNKLIESEELPKSYLWKPIRFEFDNMFTYGEGNVIDFTQMNGIYGIFGPNRIGKSSILSAFIFCLFDKFDRGFKGSHVLNSQKSSFRCKLEFELSGTRYYIERSGEAGRTGNVKVSVKFWKLENGEEIELHGTERRDTNEIIRSYIGTYEDFILTAASFQNVKNLTSFIDMGNSERKDLLVKFIGLNVFDKLHDKGNERYREISTILKSHSDRDYGEKLSQCKESLEQIHTLFGVREKLVNELQEKITTINEKIVKETSNYIKLEKISSTNLEELQKKLEKSSGSLENKKDELEKNKEKLNKLQTEIEKIAEKINKVNSNLMESYKKYKSLSNQIKEFTGKVDLKRAEIKGKLEKVEKLKIHKYDPNCKFCVDNPFVKDAYKARDELEEDKIEANKMMKKWDELQSQLKKYEWAEAAYEEHTNLLTSRNNLKDAHSELTQKDSELLNELKDTELLVKKNKEEIEIYKRNEESIKFNATVKDKINKFNLELSQIKIELKNANVSLLEVSNAKGHCESEIKKLTGLLEEIKKLEQDAEAYKYYLSSVSRDGIPYQVICSTVPAIEQEVNSILSQVVDYTVQFETDGKNIVPYVAYDYGRWPIELTSGFERFVASIVIRVSLMNISNLPKPNFISIDEGFGTLDPDNLASMTSFFTFLKHNFDFVLIISHLDELKDAVDKQIEITRIGNFSRAKYE